jgi:hypothetical protein
MTLDKVVPIEEAVSRAESGMTLHKIGMGEAMDLVAGARTV